jgi:diketogulonate reductase-like aldo/keto reductase
MAAISQGVAMTCSDADKTDPPVTRRAFVHALGAVSVAAAMPALATAPGPILKRSIPSTGEQIPAIGMGTWITFNVGSNEKLRGARTQVLQAFFDGGGGLIDSSPMYGSSEAVIGHGLARVQNRDGLFSATKVWTLLKALGVRQMEASRRLWGIPRFDLLQVHNLLDWQAHMETLKAMKAEGRLRHIGITTSHGSRHEEFEQIMLSEPLDFVQFT